MMGLYCLIKLKTYERKSFDQIHNLATEKIEEHREEKDIQISGNMVLFTSIIVLDFSAFSIYFLFFL